MPDFMSEPLSTFMRAAKALARLCECAGSSESSLLAYVVRTKIPCVDPYTMGIG